MIERCPCLRAHVENARPRLGFPIKPQAVVINLGTNDISNNKGDPGMPFRDAYRGFVETVRAKYPDALIICMIGPLLSRHGADDDPGPHPRGRAGAQRGRRRQDRVLRGRRRADQRQGGVPVPPEPGREPDRRQPAGGRAARPPRLVARLWRMTRRGRMSVLRRAGRDRGRLRSGRRRRSGVRPGLRGLLPALDRDRPRRRRRRGQLRRAAKLTD